MCMYNKDDWLLPMNAIGNSLPDFTFPKKNKYTNPSFSPKFRIVISNEPMTLKLATSIYYVS